MLNVNIRAGFTAKSADMPSLTVGLVQYKMGLTISKFLVAIFTKKTRHCWVEGGGSLGGAEGDDRYCSS